MLDILRKFNLQLFGEGGDGGTGAEGSAGDVAGEEIPSSIPARAHEIYKKSLARSKGNAQAQASSETTSTEERPHVAYKDLIKSDEYKAEHEEYMKSTLADRLKRYKGVEETNAKQNELLSMVAQKYGLDSNSESFLDDLTKSINDDDSYYERYAMEHDMSPQEARKLVSLERKLAESERQQKAQQQMEERNRINQIIISNAEKCKQIFPQFDLDTEWKNPNFVRIAQATNWDITAAYRTTHWNEIVPQAIQYATTTATNQATNAVKANKARPSENGLSGLSPTVAQTPDYSKMNLQQIREQAAQWRRGK